MCLVSGKEMGISLLHTYMKISILLDCLCLLKAHIIISLLIVLFIYILDIIYRVLMSLMALL